MWPYSDSVNIIMRRRREILVLNSNTVLTAIVCYLLLIGKAFVNEMTEKIKLRKLRGKNVKFSLADYNVPEPFDYN